MKLSDTESLQFGFIQFSSYWYTLHSVLYVAFREFVTTCGSAFCGPFKGSTAMEKTVCLPSSVSLPPAILIG